MAKIRVPETESQLSLSFVGKWDWEERNCLVNASPQLRSHVFQQTHERFNEVFRPVTFGSIKRTINDSGLVIDLAGKSGRILQIEQAIFHLHDGPRPRAVVNLLLGLRGRQDDVEKVCAILLTKLEMPLALRQTIVVQEGYLTATVPINPIIKMSIGSLQSPPVVESIVLSSELPELCDQLEARNRPYHIVAAA